MGIHTASAQHVSGALKKQYQALLLGWDAHKEGAAAPPVAKEGAAPPAAMAAADGATSATSDPSDPSDPSDAAAVAVAVAEPGSQPEAGAEAGAGAEAEAGAEAAGGAAGCSRDAASSPSRTSYQSPGCTEARSGSATAKAPHPWAGRCAPSAPTCTSSGTRTGRWT